MESGFREGLQGPGWGGARRSAQSESTERVGDQSPVPSLSDLIEAGVTFYSLPLPGSLTVWGSEMKERHDIYVLTNSKFLEYFKSVK